MPTRSSLAILFLLCISFHACNGRNLGVKINEDLKKETQHLNKVYDQKGMISALPKVKPLLSSEHEVVENNRMAKEIRVHDDSQKQNKSMEAIRKELKDQRLRSKDSVYNHDSLVSVYWRIPRKNKEGNQHPGFNLDYSPPKTHPPIHN